MAAITPTPILTTAREDMLRTLIAEQNDAFRKVLGVNAYWHSAEIQGHTLTTPGFRALPAATQIALIAKVMTFATFDADNDPLGDHSFGKVEADGAAIFWKIDLYDTDYSFGVGELADASDPAQTRRVLTLYLPSEH